MTIIKKKPTKKEMAVWKNFIDTGTPTKANTDLAKMLISDERFKEDVAEIRRHIGIAKFTEKAEKEKFLKDLTRQHEELFETKDFIKEGNEIYQKFHKGLIDRQENARLRREHFDKIWWMYVDHKVEYLCYKYNLPYNFQKYLGWYIMGNDDSQMDCPPHNFEPGEIDLSNGRSFKEAPYMTVKVYGRLSHEEIDRLKACLDYWCKRLPKHSSINNLDKKLKYEKWHNEAGSVYDHATEKEYRRTITEIAKDRLGSKKEKHTIHNAVRELKNLRKNRFMRVVD